MLRVGIVDDDPWVREGRAAALERSGEVELVLCTDHAEALTRQQWDDVDVLLVDAHDPTAGFDQFAGVRVVERVRRERGRDDVRIVVLTGHAFNDLLRVRMAEAGANVLYPHTDVRTAEALLAAVRGTLGTSPDDDHGAEEARRRTGISPAARLNDAVSWAESNVGEEALTNQPQKNIELSRRRVITARSRIAAMVGMPPAGGDGRTAPEWKEIVRFLQRARGAERRR